MTLTPTQRDLLAAAAARPDRSLHPLPDRLRGGGAKKSLDGLVARGFAEPGPEDGLVATEAGLSALARDGGDAGADEPGQKERQQPRQPRTPREGTKQAALIDLLRSDGGATLAEMTAATGWAPNTVRGALSGALKKRLGLDVRSEKVEGRGRVYLLDA